MLGIEQITLESQMIYSINYLMISIQSQGNCATYDIKCVSLLLIL